MNHGQNFKRKKKGNAFNHLDKFTAVQQLALFAPDIGEYSKNSLGLRFKCFKADFFFELNIFYRFQK